MSLSAYITITPQKPWADSSTIHFVHEVAELHHDFKIVMSAREGMQDQPGFLSHSVFCKNENEPMRLMFVYHKRGVSGLGKTKLAQLTISQERRDDTPDQLVARDRHMHLLHSLCALAHAHSLSLRIEFFNLKKQAIPA